MDIFFLIHTLYSNFHVTCAINNSLITPAATVPSEYSLRCVQHEIESATKALKRMAQTPESSDREVKKRYISPNSLFPEDQESSDENNGNDSDDDMGPSAKKQKIKLEESSSYRQRVDVKRSKDIKFIDRTSIITPPPPLPTALPNKQKLLTNNYLNNTNNNNNNNNGSRSNSISRSSSSSNNSNNNMNRPNPTTPTPAGKKNAIKGIDEVKNKTK